MKLFSGKDFFLFVFSRKPLKASRHAVPAAYWKGNGLGGSVEFGFEELAEFHAHGASGEVDDTHLYVSNTYVLTVLGHRRVAYRGDIQVSTSIIIRHLGRRDGLGDEHDPFRPCQQNRLTHLHQKSKSIDELLRVIILDEFSDNYPFQGFMNNLDQIFLNLFLLFLRTRLTHADRG